MRHISFISKRFYRFCQKPLKYGIKALQIFLILLIISFGLLFWRLQTNPIDVRFLLPHITKAMLPKGTDLHVSVDSILLKTSSNWNGFLKIEILNLKIQKKEGETIAGLPLIEMSYGLDNLLTLDYKPNILEVENAHFYTTIDKSGQVFVQNKIENSQQDFQTNPILIKDIDTFIKYFFTFDKVTLINASFELKDERNDQSLIFDNLNLALLRKNFLVHNLTFSGDITSHQNTLSLKAYFSLNHKTKHVPFQISFSSFKVSSFEHFFPEFKDLNLLLEGDISGQFDFLIPQTDFQKYVEKLSFKIKTSQKASIKLPPPLSTIYSINNLLISGKFTPFLSSAEIKTNLNISDKIPIQSNLVIDLNSFWKEHSIEGITSNLSASVQKVTVNDLPNLWPSVIAPTTHIWIKDNLKGGIIPKASFDFSFTGKKLNSLFGKVFVEGTEVNYLDGMAPIQNVEGEVFLYPNKVIINSKKGNIQDIVLNRATLLFYDLDTNIEKADMKIETTGPVNQILELVDSKPLELVKGFGIKPSQTGGIGTVMTYLNFPLSVNLSPEQVQVKVSGKIKNGLFSTPLNDLKITQVDCNLFINNKGLIVKGTGFLDKTNLAFSWKEHFNLQDEIHSVYALSGNLSTTQLTTFFPWAQDLITGIFPFSAKIQINKNNKTLIDLTADLKNTKLSLLPISSIKETNIPATLRSRFDISKKDIYFNTEFKSPKINIHLTGQSGKINQFIIHKLITQTTNLTGSLTFLNPTGFNLILKGSQWDASQLFDMSYFKKTSPQEESALKTTHSPSSPPPISIDIDIDALTLVKEKPLKSLNLHLKRKGFFWEKMQFFCQAEKPFSLNLTPNGKIVGNSRNFGDLLSRLYPSNRIMGGDLDISLKQLKKGGIKGSLEIENISLKDSGFLTQAMTILGIIDAFRGKELSFTEGEIPIEITPNQDFFIKDGYIAGRNLGITFKGQIGLKRIQISGSVIPAYAINSLPGKIPLIGTLFKDSSGGGVFGVKYDMTGSFGKPQVKFHPLSSVAPGILGRFF